MEVGSPVQSGSPGNIGPEYCARHAKSNSSALEDYDNQHDFERMATVASQEQLVACTN
jgi:hypothetical protein